MAILFNLCILSDEWRPALGDSAHGACVDSSAAFFSDCFSEAICPGFKVFWIVMHSLHEIIFIVALCYNWKIKKRRYLMVAVFLAHLSVRIWTLIYFAPTLMEFQRLPYSDTVDLILKEKAMQWRNLNIVRVVLFFMLNFLLICVLKIKQKDDE
ncbi:MULTISPECIES: hypothetical protein [Sphingobacterium]|uniref:hypothetical protein n=1 Tax=Sphingobacterium TaxID=28453 RepID=UPI00257F9C87|nr:MULTISPECIES: hypothetical protein [Sphingobacterium]